jgi:hypothetical protein
MENYFGNGMDLKFEEKIILWKYCKRYNRMKFRIEKHKLKVKSSKIRRLQKEAERFTGKSLKEILERKRVDKDKILKYNKGNNLSVSRLI